MITELLKLIGVPGQLLLVASATIALYHGRSALQIAALAGTWIRFVGLFAFLMVLLVSGVIPGAHLQVDVSTLASGVSEIVTSIREIVGVVR